MVQTNQSRNSEIENDPIVQNMQSSVSSSYSCFVDSYASLALDAMNTSLEKPTNLAANGGNLVCILEDLNTQTDLPAKAAKSANLLGSVADKSKNPLVASGVLPELSLDLHDLVFDKSPTPQKKTQDTFDSLLLAMDMDVSPVRAARDAAIADRETGKPQKNHEPVNLERVETQKIGNLNHQIKYDRFGTAIVFTDSSGSWSKTEGSTWINAETKEKWNGEVHFDKNGSFVKTMDSGFSTTRTIDGSTIKRMKIGDTDYQITTDSEGKAVSHTDAKGSWTSKDGQCWVHTQSGEKWNGKVSLDVKGNISFESDNGQLLTRNIDGSKVEGLRIGGIDYKLKTRNGEVLSHTDSKGEWSTVDGVNWSNQSTGKKWAGIVTIDSTGATFTGTDRSSLKRLAQGGWEERNEKLGILTKYDKDGKACARTDRLGDWTSTDGGGTWKHDKTGKSMADVWQDRFRGRFPEFIKAEKKPVQKVTERPDNSPYKPFKDVGKQIMDIQKPRQRQPYQREHLYYGEAEEMKDALLRAQAEMPKQEFEDLVQKMEKSTTGMLKAQRKNGEIDSIYFQNSGNVFQKSWVGDKAQRWNDTVGSDYFTSGTWDGDYRGLQGTMYTARSKMTPAEFKEFVGKIEKGTGGFFKHTETPNGTVDKVTAGDITVNSLVKRRDEGRLDVKELQSQSEKLFPLLDLNKDGRLDKEELGKAVEEPRYSGKEAQAISALFGGYDKLKSLSDDEGKFSSESGISKNDLSRFNDIAHDWVDKIDKAGKVREWAQANTPDQNGHQPGSTFDNVDGNNDGFLSRAELETAHSKAGEKSKPVYQYMLDHYDSVRVRSNDEWGSDNTGISRKDIDENLTQLTKSDEWDMISKVKWKTGETHRAQSLPDTLYSDMSNPLASINPNAVKQGGIGNCYFEAALASLAQSSPQSIRDMIKDRGDGYYTVTFPGDKDRPITVQAPGDSEMGLFGQATEHGIWANVLEKAFGEYRQKTDLWKTGVTSAEGSDGGEFSVCPKALALLSGRSTDVDQLSLTGDDTLRSKLTAAFDNGRPVTCGINGSIKEKLFSKGGSTDDGFPMGHAYSVIGWDANGPDGGTLTIRNPWGHGDDSTSGTKRISLKQFNNNFSQIAFTE